MSANNNPSDETLQRAFAQLSGDVFKKTNLFLEGGIHSDVNEYLSSLRNYLKDFMVRVTSRDCPPPDVARLFMFMEREKNKLHLASDSNYSFMQHAIIDIHRCMSMTHQIETNRRSASVAPYPWNGQFGQLAFHQNGGPGRFTGSPNSSRFPFQAQHHQFNPNHRFAHSYGNPTTNQVMNGGFPNNNIFGNTLNSDVSVGFMTHMARDCSGFSRVQGMNVARLPGQQQEIVVPISQTDNLSAITLPTGLSDCSLATANFPVGRCEPGMSTTHRFQTMNSGHHSFVEAVPGNIHAGMGWVASHTNSNRNTNRDTVTRNSNQANQGHPSRVSALSQVGRVENLHAGMPPVDLFRVMNGSPQTMPEVSPPNVPAGTGLVRRVVNRSPHTVPEVSPRNMRAGTVPTGRPTNATRNSNVSNQRHGRGVYANSRVDVLENGHASTPPFNVSWVRNSSPRSASHPQPRNTPAGVGLVVQGASATRNVDQSAINMESPSVAGDGVFRFATHGQRNLTQEEQDGEEVGTPTIPGEIHTLHDTSVQSEFTFSSPHGTFPFFKQIFTLDEWVPIPTNITCSGTKALGAYLDRLFPPNGRGRVPGGHHNLFYCKCNMGFSASCTFRIRCKLIEGNTWEIARHSQLCLHVNHLDDNDRPRLFHYSETQALLQLQRYNALPTIIKEFALSFKVINTDLGSREFNQGGTEAVLAALRQQDEFRQSVFHYAPRVVEKLRKKLSNFMSNVARTTRLRKRQKTTHSLRCTIRSPVTGTELGLCDVTDFVSGNSWNGYIDGRPPKNDFRNLAEFAEYLQVPAKRLGDAIFLPCPSLQELQTHLDTYHTSGSSGATATTIGQEEYIHCKSTVCFTSLLQVFGTLQA